jgi:predicted membrane metal-binding protein
MAALYFAARAADLRSPPLNALAFVAACLLSAQPFSAVDPAFVLTFGATLAILSIVPAQPWIRIPRFLKPAASMFAASVATEAMLFPVGALLFSRVTFAGLALNFLAIPLMALAQIAGMVVVPVALVSTPFGRVPGFLAHVGAAGLVRSANLVEWAPAASFRVAPPSWPVVAIYYAALVAAWCLRRRSVGEASRVRGPSPESRASWSQPLPRSGCLPNHGRLPSLAATSVFTCHLSTSGRATPRSCGFPEARRCLPMRAGW